MLYIEYCATGHPVNDFELDNEVSWVMSHVCDEQKKITDEADEFLYYSTENIFNRIRLEIVSGNISENDIIFVYEDVQFPVNRFGAIMNWPNGFCDVNIRMSESILRKALSKKKIERLEG